MQTLQEMVDDIIATTSESEGHIRIPAKLFRKVVEWAYSDGRLSALKEQRDSLQVELDTLRDKQP